MAGPETCCNFSCNFLPAGKNEIAAKILTNNNSTYISTLVVLRALLLTLIIPAILAFISIKELCQQLMKTYMATNQFLEQNQESGPYK